MTRAHAAEPRVRAAAVVVAALVSTLSLGGCAATGELFGGRKTATEAQAVVEESGVSLYLAEMHTLATGTPDAQNKLFASIQRRAERSPTTTNRLGRALALATSGHAGTDLGRGRDALRALLADPGLLLATERQLAELVVHDIELRQRLVGDSRAQQEQTARATAGELETLRRSLAATRAENTRLQQALADAEEKLRAITSIERSIRERTDEDLPQQ